MLKKKSGTNCHFFFPFIDRTSTHKKQLINRKKKFSNTMAESSLEIKVLLLGDSDTGKTSFVERLITGNFTPSKRVNVDELRCLSWDTSHGRIEFQIGDLKFPISSFDISTVKEFDNKRTKLLPKFDAVILFIDTRSLSNWLKTYEFINRFKNHYRCAFRVMC
jgi:GTPase SAR1 family protein